MAARVSDTLTAVVPFILINANRSVERYRHWADDIVSDSALTAGQGPLAGLLAGMVRAQALGFEALMVSPCDTPDLTPALCGRLMQAAGPDYDHPVLASVAGRLQPLHGIYPVALASVLANYLASGERRVEAFALANRALAVDCSDRPEDFANRNRPDDFPDGVALV
jgi:molybdopterin-guanine dinucleotide biosynthesis protein A